jgi:hypothetical protein
MDDTPDLFRHCERSEAIHVVALGDYGLLRFARNDGDSHQMLTPARWT